MTITISRRATASAAALVALLGGGLIALSGGHPAASAATTSPMASVACVGAVSGPIPLTSTKIHGLTGLPIGSASHGLIAPIDPATGLSSGRTVQKVYTFTLSNDAAGDANIVLTNALLNHENLKTCTFRYFHADAAGKIVPFLTVVLTNAHLSSYSFKSPGSTQWQAAFQKIKWTGPAGKVAQDDWEAPVS